ncbi:hypothetical protein EYF80_016797 [Liparis tanakae]|uniref:Uncharacterized protein n=1 Tax=Liparis tanakae TaxID=230148 RepID=A0A4Z2I4S6_9TELE|nr:hypothetical protein EYF80_016797 [Liparis tanakae]
MAGGRMPLMLLVVLAEVLSGVCVPGDGSGKSKGSWRWKETGVAQDEASEGATPAPTTEHEDDNTLGYTDCFVFFLKPSSVTNVDNLSARLKIISVSRVPCQSLKELLLMSQLHDDTGKGKAGPFALPRLVVPPITSMLRGPRFCEESSTFEKGLSTQPTGSPVGLQA